MHSSPIAQLRYSRMQSTLGSFPELPELAGQGAFNGCGPMNVSIQSTTNSGDKVVLVFVAVDVNTIVLVVINWVPIC